MTFYTFQTPKMVNALTMHTYFGDADYMDLLGMTLVQGRKFDKNLASDSSGLIINEAAAKALDLGDNPIGAKVNEDLIVIGIVKDFHWESLRNAIAPVAILMNKEKHNWGISCRQYRFPIFLKQQKQNGNKSRSKSSLSIILWMKILVSF